MGKYHSVRSCRSSSILLTDQLQCLSDRFLEVSLIKPNTLIAFPRTKQTSGGPAGLIYGFLLIWLGNISVFIAIGELSSAIPTAGGQYHWVSLLAPRSSKRFFSYITGMSSSLLQTKFNKPNSTRLAYGYWMDSCIDVRMLLRSRPNTRLGLSQPS